MLHVLFVNFVSLCKQTWEEVDLPIIKRQNGSKVFLHATVTG